MTSFPFFYYFTRSRIYRHRDYILLPKSIMEAFSSNSFPNVCDVWVTFLRALEIFYDEVFIDGNQYKTEQSWCSAIIIRKRSAICINHDNTVNPLIKQSRSKMPAFNYLSLVAQKWFSFLVFWIGQCSKVRELAAHNNPSHGRIAWQ